LAAKNKADGKNRYAEVAEPISSKQLVITPANGFSQEPQRFQGLAPTRAAISARVYAR